MDETLAESDAADILEELLSAQNQSYLLGMKLKLPLHEVEAIHLKYLDPRERLLHVIVTFLRQAEPRPTWRVIVEALRNPIVNLPALARRVVAAHFPDPTATREPSTVFGESAIDLLFIQCKCTSSHLQLQSRILPPSHLNQLVTTVSTRPGPTIMSTLFVTQLSLRLGLETLLRPKNRQATLVSQT